MNVKKEITNFEEIDFKIPIKKKQEVIYTTLKLSQSAHEAIKELAQMQGLKHAEVFDSMLVLFDAIEGSNSPLQFKADKGRVVTTRKTYVLNKETLNKLNRVVKSKEINRDLFVDKMAVVFKFIVDKQISEKKNKYPQILKEYIIPFLEHANSIEEKLHEEVGGDDPISRRFSYILTLLMALEMAIEGNIEQGTLIDPEDISQQ